MQQPPVESTTARSVERALSILDVFLKEKRPLSIADLHRSLDLPKPTVFRLVRGLESFGYLVRKDNDSNKYWLGSKILQLSSIINEKSDLSSLAMPILKKLRDETRETAHLNIIEKDERVCVYCLHGTKEIRYVVNIGDRSPLHLGASAKLMLAYMTDDFINQYIKRNQITDSQKLWDQLLKVRKQGYCITVGERSIDGIGVSAPVRDASGKVIAAIAVSAPAARLSREAVERYTLLAVKSAGELSSQLGHVINV